MDERQRLARMLIAATQQAGGELVFDQGDLDAVNGLAVRFDEEMVEPAVEFQPIGYHELVEGEEVEVKIDAPMFPQVDGDWERRRVVSIDDGGLETNEGRVVRFANGEREYDVEAAKDRTRLMRRRKPAGESRRVTVVKVITRDEAIALGEAQRRLARGPGKEGEF